MVAGPVTSYPLECTVLETWTGLANGESGGASSAGAYGDKTVQVTGTFGAGGTVLIEGSNDGSSWATLMNTVGTALSLTTNAVHVIAQCPFYIRPRCSAGDGTTALAVRIFGRR